MIKGADEFSNVTKKIHNGLQGMHLKLTDTDKDTDRSTIYLLKNPEEAKKMGERGREHILRNFLMTRHLKDYLKLFTSLSN